jgi:hypothetical protein
MLFQLEKLEYTYYIEGDGNVIVNGKLKFEEDNILASFPVFDWRYRGKTRSFNRVTVAVLP